MLAIRMQRIGRSGHAHFRVVVQDSRQSPKSGKFVAQLGSYDPHTKTVNLVKDKAQTYLNNGAQPSDRVVSLFKSEGIKLPKWVAAKPKKEGKTKNIEKLRKNRPAGPEAVADKPTPEEKTEDVVEVPENPTETKEEPTNDEQTKEVTEPSKPEESAPDNKPDKE